MGKEVVLRNTSEKFAYLRETLNITTKDLAGDKVTEKFIRMVERQKRNMSKDTAIEVMRNVIDFANEKGIDLDLDEEYLARSKEDDLCEICDKLENIMENRDIFNKIIEYAEENNYPWAKIVATKKIGNLFFINGEFNKAYETYIKCLEMIDSLHSNRHKENIYLCIGSVKLKNVQYEEALVYYEEALNYCYMNNRFNVKSRIEYNIALTLNNLGDFHKSIKVVNNSLSYNMEKSVYFKMQILNVSNYINLSLLGQATDICKKILAYKEIKDITKSIAYGNIAVCYMEKGDYENSNRYFDLAIEVAKFVPNVKYKIVLDKAYMKKKFGRYEEAKKLFLDGMELSEDSNDYEYKFKYLQELYLLEEKSKNIKSQKDIARSILSLAREFELQEQMLWARKKLIDIAIKENDLSILKEA